MSKEKADDLYKKLAAKAVSDLHKDFATARGAFISSFPHNRGISNPAAVAKITVPRTEAILTDDEVTITLSPLAFMAFLEPAFIEKYEEKAVEQEVAKFMESIEKQQDLIQRVLEHVDSEHYEP